MSPAHPLELWFDFSSTYSYLAVHRAPSLAARAGVTLHLRPFLLGPIFQAWLGVQDSPFNRQPGRGRYMWRDLQRECHKLGLPFHVPPRFPVSSVVAARVFHVVPPERSLAYVHAVFHALFGGGQDISTAEVIGQVLEGLGLQRGLLEAATTGESKGRLRAATEEAMSRGVFGAPTFFVDGEPYFGNERLDDALQHAVTGAGVLPAARPG